LNHDSPTWFKQAIINPGSVFANPEDVMSSPDLELDEKIRVLRSWQYDVAELAVAEEEGMRGSQNGMLRRILLPAVGTSRPRRHRVSSTHQASRHDG